MTDAEGYARAVAIVEAACTAAMAEARPVRSQDPGERKVSGSALDIASRAGRITALGAVLEQLTTAAPLGGYPTNTPTDLEEHQ